MYLQKVTSRKNCVRKLEFAGILKVNDKNSRIRIQDPDPGSGSGSGSISQRHGSADLDPDPDPHQNVMDPEKLNSLHWYYGSKLFNDKLSINSTNVFGQKIVFFRDFRRGKGDLRVRKDDFDAVFFLSATPQVGRLAESGSRRLADSRAKLRWGTLLCRFAQSIFRDGSGRFVQGAQHPRIFGRRHIGRGRTNIAPFQAAANPIVPYCTYSHYSIINDRCCMAKHFRGCRTVAKSIVPDSGLTLA